MKSVKSILISMILGAAAGAWLGVNYGMGKPLLSNPFIKPTLSDRAKWKAEEIYKDLEK